MLSQDQRLQLDAVAVLSYLIIARLIGIRSAQHMLPAAATRVIDVLKNDIETVNAWMPGNASSKNDRIYGGLRWVIMENGNMVWNKCRCWFPALSWLGGSIEFSFS